MILATVGVVTNSYLCGTYYLLVITPTRAKILKILKIFLKCVSS
jgi:hypothetical protein